ncbi:MAG: hypothetical protein IKK63_09425 [Clostridia bacterium]|nr:hypothetical protein [Clostridia bacterium]
MKKSIRILSILMAFVMLIGSFSVMGSAYQAYKGNAIADSYDDVDKPVFTLEQYASMGLDEVDRMLAKEQLELDLFGLLYLNLTSIDATIASVEQFLETGDVLLDMLGDLKTLPEIVDPILGLRRNTVADLDIIHAVLDMVAGLRTIAAKYVKNDPNAPLDAGLLNGLIADYIFNVRELAIGVVYGLTEEGKEFDYMDVMNIDDVPDKYKDNENGILNLGQALLNELVLGEWKMIDEELDNKCSVLMKGSYAWKDASGNDVSGQAINTTAYDYYAWVHPDDWVTVGLGGATRVTAGAAAPAADLGCCDITTDKNGYEFIEALMQQAYNYLLVPVITRDTVDWVLELCGYSFDETKTQRTKWDPTTQTWIDNDDYDPDYHGYIAADEDLTKIAELFNHEGLADGSIRMPKVTIPAGETLVGNFNDILGEFAELIVKKTYTRDGVTLPWTWTYGGNEHLFHNIAELGKFVVFVTDDLFFNKRSEIPKASEIAAMDSDQQIVALVMREILNNSVDYIYIDDSYDTVVDVAYRAVEQLAWQDIPQFTYTKPVRTGYATDEAYYEAVVIKMIDILFDIAVYNLNQGFDMNKANGSNPLTDTGLLQYQGDAALGSYENNLVQIAAWAFENYAAILPFTFNSATKGAALTADQVWEDIDTVINALIPIKGDGAWINSEIAGNGTEIVSKRFIFDYILKPLYCLDATNFAKIFERNEDGAFAEMNGVEIIVDLLDSVFDLLFPNVFQNLGTLDAVVQNTALSEMVFDLIGTLGASSFTNSAGQTVEGRGTYIAKTALPIVCMVLGLSDDQEFEEMEIYLPEIVAANEGAPTFKIFNGSSGINTGYTDKYGNFDQDDLYKYVVRTVNVYDYNSLGTNTGALTVAGVQAGTEITGGANIDVTINGTLTAGNLIEFAITYVVMGEDGTSITGVDKNNNEITLSKTVYAYVGSTAEDDDAIEVEIKVGETGRSIKYENVMYLDSGDDLDDIEGKMIRVVDLSDEGKTTGTATVTGVTNSSTAYPFAAVNADADQITVALEGKGGTYFITPFDVAKNGVDEEGNDKYFERFEYIYAKDEDGNTLYDEETGEPIIAEDDAGNLLNNGGVVNGLYNISAAVNVAGTNVNVPVAVHLYDGYGLESAFDRAVSENRQISNYDKEAEEGAVQDHWNAYVALLKDIAKFVLKPKTSATFQADIATTNSAYENKYEEYRVALDEAIENLEKYALNTGTGALKNAYNVKSGLNYEIRYDDAGYPYRYDYKYYEDEYVFFGMRDYVPHTYNRYKDARGRVADLINSQEVFVMAPFTDVDIYGEGYEASQEELDARSASIAAYLEAKENLGVIGSIESLYAIHMIELTGDRLIALTGDTSKLEEVYAMCGNAIEAGTEGQYTVDSREAYQHAETFTEAVLADEDATPSMINTATTELVYAWKRLEKCADYSKLDAAIAAAQGTVSENGDDAQAQTNFTPDSYQALLDAYNAAVNVDRNLGASDNEYLNELAANLEDAFAALAPASAGEPSFDISTEEKFANIDWSMWYAPYLDEMGVMNLGYVVAPDGATPVDAFLILGNGVFSDFDITSSFVNVENAEFVVTPNEMGNYGTGAVVQVFDAEGTLYKTYVVVVRGDVNGDAGFDSGDTDEVDMQGAYIYDWFWNSYGTNDQYKAIAGDVTGDGSIDSGDTDMLDMAAAYMGYYDMIYGGEIF